MLARLCAVLFDLDGTRLDQRGSVGESDGIRQADEVVGEAGDVPSTSLLPGLDLSPA